MTEKNITDETGTQAAEAVASIGAAMLVLAEAAMKKSVEKGEIVITDLAKPLRTNFGKFGRKTDFKYSCKPGVRLSSESKIDGIDAFALVLKSKEGDSQVVEIGHNSDDMRQRITEGIGNPARPYVVIIHGEQITPYFVNRTDINYFATVGQPFTFGSETSLGGKFQGGEVEKIVGFTKPVA